MFKIMFLIFWKINRFKGKNVQSKKVLNANL